MCPLTNLLILHIYSPLRRSQVHVGWLIPAFLSGKAKTNNSLVAGDSSFLFWIRQFTGLVESGLPCQMYPMYEECLQLIVSNVGYRLVAWTSIVKNKMKPPNPNAHMNLPDTPDMTLLERHSWETLLGRPSWEDTFGMTLLGDTLGRTLLVRHSWHDTLVGPSWEDTLWKTLLT